MTHPETRGAGLRPFFDPDMKPLMNERSPSTLALDFLWLIEPFLGGTPDAGLGGTLLVRESIEPTSVRESVAGFLVRGEAELEPTVGEERLTGWTAGAVGVSHEVYEDKSRGTGGGGAHRRVLEVGGLLVYPGAVQRLDAARRAGVQLGRRRGRDVAGGRERARGRRDGRLARLRVRGR